MAVKSRRMCMVRVVLRWRCCCCTLLGRLRQLPGINCHNSISLVMHFWRLHFRRLMHSLSGLLLLRRRGCCRLLHCRNSLLLRRRSGVMLHVCSRLLICVCGALLCLRRCLLRSVRHRRMSLLCCRDRRVSCMLLLCGCCCCFAVAAGVCCCCAACCCMCCRVTSHCMSWC